MHDPRDYFTTHRGKTRMKSKRQHRALHIKQISHSHYEYRAGRYVYKREKLPRGHYHRVPKSFRSIEARE
jgi:hypothetical protein